MLGSITPLGERSRKQRWGVTVAFHVIGGVGAGAALGAALGWAGALTMTWLGVGLNGRFGVLAAVVAAAVAADLVRPGRAIPGPRRQVNEQWLHRYRGWVYGLVFGAQLGVGVATFVTTAAVYATLAAAVVSGSAVRGALIVGTFGGVRALTVLAAAGVRRPDQIVAVDARLRAWDGPSRWAGVVGQTAMACTALVVLLGGAGS